MEANFALGTVMADCADIVIIVGERPGIKGLIRGLVQSGFPNESIFTAEDMEEGESMLHENVSTGDTVLFEGRIPEYEEI